MTQVFLCEGYQFVWKRTTEEGEQCKRCFKEEIMFEMEESKTGKRKVIDSKEFVEKLK